ATNAAVRTRTDGEVIPNRDPPGDFHLPHARVRADGDGVLRPAGGRGGVAPPLARRAHGLVHGARDPTRPPAPPRARRGRALALLERDVGHRVPVPDGLV